MHRHHKNNLAVTGILLACVAFGLLIGLLWPRAEQVHTVLIDGPVRYVDRAPPAYLPNPVTISPVTAPVFVGTRAGPQNEEHAETKGLNLGVYQALK